MEKSTILYVDDEAHQLRTFATYMSEYFKVFTAETGAKGLELLRQHPEIRVVITDEKMDSMSGIEFLQGCQKVAPEAPRIMLTGHVSEALMKEAINAGHVDHFYEKPIDRRILEVVRGIQSAVETCILRQVVKQGHEELRAALVEVKASKEKDIAIARLESRQRIVDEIGHHVNNPSTTVYGFYQVIGQRLGAYGEQAKKGKVGERELRELVEGLVKIWKDYMEPDMERLIRHLQRLDRFIRDEKDPVGDVNTPLQEEKNLRKGRQKN
ncbi:MAG: response regulator [Deltaproteobacteria bacterium]|nr:response regulator [Deltaproteobacteria bacterium]